MAERVVLRVLMTWLVIVGTTSAQDPIQPHVERLSEAISIATISTDAGPLDPTAFNEFIDFLETKFPKIHSSPLVKFDVINDFSLLYYIDGTDIDRLPYLLAAHYDVVPANEPNWKYPPFDKVVKDGFIYGRGTLDDKSRLMAIMESLENELNHPDFRPFRSFYLAFGHDEEVSGYNGAKEIAEHLLRQQVKLEFILDEGTPILQSFTKLVPKPIALISVAEKGYATVRLTANGTSGHSAMPPRNTTTARLSRAIKLLQENPMPINFNAGLVKAMVHHLAPEYSECIDIMTSGRSAPFFRPSLTLIADHNPFINALFRTTTAATIVEGGVKDNVLPDSSTAIVNHRVNPLDTIEEVLRHDQELIKDEDILFENVELLDPSPFSPYDDTAFGYQKVKQTIQETFPDVAVSPGLNVGSTDTKWYRQLTSQVYRFSPFIATAEDIQMIHGVNEKISIENYDKMIEFFEDLMENADESA